MRERDENLKYLKIVLLAKEVFQVSEVLYFIGFLMIS